MEVSTALRRSAIGLILSCSFPIPGTADLSGSITVIAPDSHNSSSTPPSTSAILNGTQVANFGTNNWVSFSGMFEEGVHTVEVETGTIGYALRPSPTDPMAINDPDSHYGNPRHVHIVSGASYVSADFIFDPLITASATVRDGWTMERLEDVAIEFIWTNSSNTYSKTKYPANANYATNWVTDTAGTFPPDTMMYLHDYDLRLTLNGYEDLYTNHVIIGAAPGDHFDLGTLFLYPDDINENNINDGWENMHFTGNCLGEEDADGDGHSNFDEYLAGTDPTNWHSCLWLFQTLETDGSLLYEWDTVEDRTYRICGTTNLQSDTWVQVGGAWEATNGQFTMTWAETNHHLSWCSSYRVEIVPSGWTGTNSILIHTNDWPTSGGGSSTNSYPGGPPIP